MDLSATRLVCPDFISTDQCSELIAIHRALSVVGYRPGVFSTTIQDVALAAPHLLVPLVGAGGWTVSYQAAYKVIAPLTDPRADHMVLVGCPSS